MNGERFTRWQNNAITQLTFSINVFLGLAAAVLGYAVSLLTSDKFAFNGISRFLFAGAMLCQLFSLLAGIVVVITRTLDFRLTARITRNIQKKRDVAQTELWRKKAKALGRTSWRLFWMQIFFFVVGILSLLASVFITYKDRVL
jgi:hypothetical protein